MIFLTKLLNDMEQNTNITMWIVVLVVLVAGAGGGYYYGYSKGEGAYVASQQKAAQEAITQTANPFDSDQAGPVQSNYQNPFETAVNPFK